MARLVVVGQTVRVVLYFSGNSGAVRSGAVRGDLVRGGGIGREFRKLFGRTEMRKRRSSVRCYWFVAQQAHIAV